MSATTRPIRARPRDCPSDRASADGSEPGPERHRRLAVGDADDERHGVRVLRQLLAEQDPRAAKRVGERGLARERDPLEPPRRSGERRRERQRDRRLGDSAAERDERDLVAAAGRVLEQPEHDPLRLLDHPLGVHRPRVVDDEADRERRAVLAHLPPQVGRLDPDRRDRRASPPPAASRRPRRRSRAAAGEPVARVLALPVARERARATPGPRALDAVAREPRARRRRPRSRRAGRFPAHPSARPRPRGLRHRARFDFF